MRIFQLTTAAVIATSTSLPTIVTAQDSITCSCTPTAYSFSLNFDGNCGDSSFGGDGIDGSICFFTEGGDPANLDAGMIAGISAVPPTRGRRLGNTVVEKNEEWVDTVLSKVDFTNHIQHAAAAHATRQLQSLDTTPTVITSVTFLEADTSPSFNIINQDSTYFETDLFDGDILEYTSISSALDPSMPIGDQLDKVPGGVFLVLFGTNAAGVVVQNSVTWGYVNNYCEDDELLAIGSDIGWISLSGFGSPYVEFCDAVTAPPSRSPSKAPSAAPSTNPTSSPTVFSKSSKSKSEKATTNSSKTEKMSLPSYAKSKKGDTKSSKLMAAVSHLAAINGKLHHFIYYNF